MATELTIRLYFDERREPGEIFRGLVQAVSSWDDANELFHDWRVDHMDRRTRLAERDGPFPAAELLSTAEGAGGPEQLLSATTSFQCWRFQESIPQRGAVAAWVEAWGERYSERCKGPVRWEGLAAFTPMTCGPFCAVVGDEGPMARIVNERVEENLGALTGLIFGIVESLAPTSVKVFTDQGLYLPFNAHFAYYRDPERGPIDDLLGIAQVWAEGLPPIIPPLSSYSERAHGVALHHWRDEAQRLRLWSRLDPLVSRASRVTPEIVRGILKSQRFDTYSMPSGMSVLEYPQFMNSFLDDFFIEILEATPGK